MLGRAVSTPGLLKIHCSVPMLFWLQKPQVEDPWFCGLPRLSWLQGWGVLFFVWIADLIRSAIQNLFFKNSIPICFTLYILLWLSFRKWKKCHCNMTMSHCLSFTWYFQFLWDRYNDGHLQPDMKQNRKVTKILRADQDKKKKKKSLLLVLVMQSQLFKN